MKVIFALIFLAATASGQAFSCPEGTKPSGGIGTSGCMWELGCYTPAQIESGYTFIAKCICGETGISMGTGMLEYSRTNKWVDGACITRERWLRRIGDEWVEITKEEYEKRLATKPQPAKRRRRHKR